MAQPFTFTYEIESGTASDGNVVSIDGNADTDYAWTPSQATLAGVYTYGGSLYQSGDGYAANNGVSLSLPAQVRFRKSGDDIQIDYSTDSGGSWTPYVTRVGVLAGKTSLNVKALFAVPSSQKRVKVKASQ